MNKRGLISYLRHYFLKDRLQFYFQLLIFQVVFYTILLYYSIPVLEGTRLTWAESALFVLQTMTTVGYDLLTFFPVQNQLTIILTIIIMCTGVFTFLMIIPAVLEPYLQDMLKPVAPSKVPRKIQGHVLVIGFTEISKSLIDSLLVSGLKIILVDDNPKNALSAIKYYKNYKRDLFVVSADYEKNDTWTGVYADSARDVIICEDERKSATIILGIRKKTTASITSIIDDLSYARYLKYAGADHVFSPKDFTGKIIARHASLTPEVDIIYQASLRDGIKKKDRWKDQLKFVYIPVTPDCKIIGKTLNELNLFENYGVDPVFIIDKDNFYIKEKENIKIQRSTTIFLLGKADAISELIKNELTCPAKNPEKLAVIAGFGDLGQVVYKELKESGVRSYVIDPKSSEPFAIASNAEDESALTEAHIEEAEVFIAAVNSDEANIFSTLLARNLNPTIHILARANRASNVEKLYRAGADYVALLPTTSGQIVAGIVLHGIVSVLLDLPGNRKVILKHNHREKETTVGWCERVTGAKIIAVEGRENTLLRPSADDKILKENDVIAYGSIRSIRKLIEILSGDEQK
ncbi:potassium transporter TrkA [Methanoplanus sp. FWC-SCC4]|uniref:Potassium transporter TrkA n=1 Tax=Methanochimaera problematica TaxID=2609417 RepID=A0AA97I333_9EURY|nr:NAD-binding protein [Methanoplanus sp. FWC-SCC4]WOF15254.1 potassium transporter TrkA [Methanoplanus sp. FWC-SCC4]